MDTPVKPQNQFAFHLTGKIHGAGLEPIQDLDLRPALLAPYRDLAALRHDFPVVLDARIGGPEFVRTLSGVVDGVLRDVAPRGIDGERLRRHGLQLETAIRRAIAGGASGNLATLWAAAVASVGAREGDLFEQVLERATDALHIDGEVLGCTPQMVPRLMTHAWRFARHAKALRFHADLARLTLKVSDILRAAYAHSQASREPDSLRQSLGGPHRGQFDFSALSRIVGKGVPRDELSPTRRARLVNVLHVLEEQCFVAPPGAEDEGTFHDYVFDNCADAARAWRERLADLTELVKAMAIAELEIKGRYAEDEHDAVFEAFDAAALTAVDLARFPDYLVCIPPGRNDAPENAGLMSMLSSGMPVKVLVQTADLLDASAIGTGQFAFGVRSERLATSAMALGGMFVLQCAASNLVALRGRIARGMACAGPALFSVYAGAPQSASRLPPYLSAAAAMQARAFPAFSYDALAGLNWAERFSLENNPRPEDDWPVETLEYGDDEQQRVSETLAFTDADFALCDARQAAHFALVPRASWHARMLPVANWLALPEAEAVEYVPFVLAVDADDALQRLVVDAKLMQATRRCLLLWRRLQEHGGVHDSHAERLLAKEKAAWAAQQQPASPAPAAASPAGAAASPAGAAEVPEAPATPEHSRDEAWIETARCPSCNECQLINDRMFGYDDKKQAFIKDLKAGTYRQMVEAAESCQVAIIHPGAPWDPKEPGLEELLVRAEAFR
ncbi:MAG TPA: hypothetical protein VFV17_06575 [Usitatibacteraceae bacterium]|nr:hypothetical protein [Usitatibacteraceae bacterium]